MAAYPSVAQRIGSVIEPDDGTRVSRAPSGKPIFRNYFSAARNVFRISHDCTNAEKLSIESHYSGDRMNGFSFTFSGDGVAYTVRYADAPKCTPIVGTTRWIVEVVFVEQ